MRSRFSVLALAVAAALPSIASAVDFSYNGFSTAAYSQTDTDDAEVGYSGQPNGIDSDGSFESDSKLGVQVTAKFNDSLSATVQGVAYTDLTGDWEPRLDWAYLRLQATPSVAVRAGYLRAPTFMYSDSVFIGYANVWVRPPLEVYNMSPVYQMRGVDVTWRGSVGPVQVSVNPYFGDSEVDLPNDTLEVPSWLGVATTFEYSSWLARLGYSEIELGSTTGQLVPLIDSMRAVGEFCAPCAAEADRLDLDGPTIETTSLGVQYDDGTNFAAAELARGISGGNYLVPNREGAYITYGRRFGGFMPYATYAQSQVDNPDMSAIPMDGQFAAFAFAVNATLAGGYSDQQSYSAGLRYDLPAFSVLSGALVKLQFDHIDAKGGNGMLNNVQPGFDHKVNMITASFDFIF
jgi:hypothetical protein